MTCLLCRQSFLAKALLSLVNEQAFCGLGREKRREGLKGGDDGYSGDIFSDFDELDISHTDDGIVISEESLNEVVNGMFD